VSKKSPRIAALIAGCQGQALDAHYLGYFVCFNGGLFYEAHDVLEELWLGCRRGPNDAFYKGLIQLAGAFVHLQKHAAARPRLRPSAALLKLARANLVPYAPRHEHLELEPVLGLIEQWLGRLEAGEFRRNPLDENPPPRLELPGGAGN
jgi:predicted metal-dependent hydrolase